MRLKKLLVTGSFAPVCHLPYDATWWASKGCRATRATVRRRSQRRLRSDATGLRRLRAAAQANATTRRRSECAKATSAAARGGGYGATQQACGGCVERHVTPRRAGGGGAQRRPRRGATCGARLRVAACVRAELWARRATDRPWLRPEATVHGGGQGGWEPHLAVAETDVELAGSRVARSGSLSLGWRRIPRLVGEQRLFPPKIRRESYREEKFPQMEFRTSHDKTI